jgi:hypothetical protein
VRRRAILVYVPHHCTGWVLEALRHRSCPCSRLASRLPTGLVNLSKNNGVERRSTLVEEDQLEITCMARLSRRCPCPSLPLPRAGPQCARSRSLGMPMRAVSRILSSLVTERRMPMSSRRVGWAGLVGSGVWSADTREWAELETWHGGRWGRLRRAFRKWEYVDTPGAPDSAK